MKERPILFTGAMVRAIREGRKTQTRRLVNPQPQTSGKFVLHDYGWQDELALCEPFSCPYGTVGNRLWLKETFSAQGVFGADGRVVYRADIKDGKEPHGLNWKPSIFMPRKLSRVTLGIVSIGIERLQEISADDADKEGVGCGVDDETGGPVARYSRLWGSINGKDSWCSWAGNPYVWRIEFRVI